MRWPWSKKKDTDTKRLENQIAELKRTLYAAAKTTRLTGRFGTPVSGETVNDIIGMSSSVVGARVQQLVRDFPIFAKAVEAKTTHIVGSGIIYQSRIRKANGQLNQTINSEIEYWFNKWADNCDIAGRMSFWEMQELAVRQRSELGEHLFLKHITKNGLNLQAIEPTQIDDTIQKSTDAIQTINGIETDTQTGKALAIYIRENGYSYKSKRYPIDNFIHGFKVLRPGQVRGISPFASAILLAKDLSDLMEAELSGAKMASKWLAFITRNDISGIYGTETQDDGKVIEDLENGIIEYLNQGESVNLASSNRPGNNFSPFIRLLIQFASAATGVPYELLSADYSGMNYTVLRGVRNDFSHSLKPEIEAIIRQFCWPVFYEWFRHDPNVKLRDKLSNFDKYTRGIWVSPPMAQIDPLKENKAWIDAIANGLRSPQEFFATQGREIEDVYNEIKAAQDLRKEKGIDLEPAKTSTEIASNPSSISPEDE